MKISRKQQNQPHKECLTIKSNSNKMNSFLLKKHEVNIFLNFKYIIKKPNERKKGLLLKTQFMDF